MTMTGWKHKLLLTLLAWSWCDASDGARVWMVKGGVTGMVESRLIRLLEEGTLSYSTGQPLKNRE